MTAHLTLVAGTEDRGSAVARRLREQIAGRRINAGVVAARLGVSTMWMSRRTSGYTVCDVRDLVAIEHATGISADYLFTGHGPTDAPTDPDGGEEVRHQGLEPRTR